LYKHYFLRLIVQRVQFNLVCGWNFLVQFASTALMGGFLISSFTAGALSDRYMAYAS